MKRIVLLIAPFIFFTCACSGGDDSELQLGDSCQIHQCIDGVYYHCLRAKDDQPYYKIDLIASCNDVCQIRPEGNFVFTGTCGEFFPYNVAEGCCNCYDQEEDWEACVGVIY